ncbi:hypothetical protein ABW20_dc0100362 [Dactylellina cionopaga]|nr:hypothetical protein ABW20_dc0100362 [Dactylellina cionopaga]
MSPLKLQPLTDSHDVSVITQWLSRCERDFETWEELENRQLSDKTKIRLTGNAIPGDKQPTRKLHEWWAIQADKLSKGTWVEFKTALKDEALGKEWIFAALCEFYTTRQNFSTAKEYFTKMKSLSSVISGIGNGVPPIDPLFEAFHLLFQASEGAMLQIINQEIKQYPITAVTSEKIYEWLEKYSSGESKFITLGKEQVPDFSIHLKPLTDSSLTTYVVTGTYPSMSEQARYLNRQKFTDLQDLPQSPPYPKVNSLTIWHQFSGIGYIHAYQFFHTTGNYRFPSFDQQTKLEQASTLIVEADEYIGSVQFHIEQVKSPNASPARFAVKDMRVSTSKGKALQIGENRANWTYDISAPTGWSIVGFRGCYSDWTKHPIEYPWTYMTAFGCIFAPI